jgi:hypothetical protein
MGFRTRTLRGLSANLRVLRVCARSTKYFGRYLLPGKKKQSKQKTSTKQKTLNPVWNETMYFDFSAVEVVRTDLAGRDY